MPIRYCCLNRENHSSGWKESRCGPTTSRKNHVSIGTCGSESAGSTIVGSSSHSGAGEGGWKAGGSVVSIGEYLIGDSALVIEGVDNETVDGNDTVGGNETAVDDETDVSCDCEGVSVEEGWTASMSSLCAGKPANCRFAFL